MDRDQLPKHVAKQALEHWLRDGRARYLRERAGLTTAEFATLVGPAVSAQDIEASERGIWRSTDVLEHLNALRRLQRRVEADATVAVSLRDRFGAYQLLVRADDHIGLTIATSSRPYEHRLLATIGVLLKAGSIVMDVGANIGNHTVSFARRGCRVYAFEPNADARVLLQSNVDANALNALVTVFGLAAADHSGRGRMHVPVEGNLGSGEVADDPDGDVEFALIDALHLGRVDLIKIDVEGAEAAVLRGAMATVREYSPLVLVELKDAAALRAATELLRPLGYRRLPSRLTGEPTYLFATSLRPLLRAAATRGYGYHLTRRLGSRARDVAQSRKHGA